MEYNINISWLNDFIFCPRSIYFHQLYSDRNKSVYQSTKQINGIFAHTSIDSKKYSNKKNILQSMGVYSEKYNLHGVIDLFDIGSGLLSERKKEIKTIYDGYVFQIYAQCLSLREMNYTVREMCLYDYLHNKKYEIPLPENNPYMFKKFENIINKIKNYDINSSNFNVNPNKCSKCIYSNLCDFTPC